MDDVCKVDVALLVRKCDCVLILDGSTPDEHHARKIEPSRRHLSGEHRNVVPGVNLGGSRPISRMAIGDCGLIVHLEGFGRLRVSRLPPERGR